VRVEEVVGWQVRERRERLGLTQEQLGRQLEPYLGRAWSRQAVSAAEKGERSFGAAELVALATVLRATVGDLLRPPVQETAVDLGGPDMVPKEMLLAAVAAKMRENPNFDAIQETLTLLADAAARSQEDVARTLLLAQNLDLLVTEQVIAGPTPPWADSKELRAQPAFTNMPPVVAAIVTSDRGVLVGRRRDGRPPWTFIAGEMEPGEQPGDTATREVKEETGLEVRAGDIIGERYHPKTERMMYYITATPVRGLDVFVGDEDELAEVRWVSLAEADELLPGMFDRVHDYLEREIGGER
jgi:8-oxo-dGTP diphosphatase